MSNFLAEAKSALSSQTSAFIKANAESTDIMHAGQAGSNNHTRLGIGTSTAKSAEFYRQYKQWVFVCIDAIASRVKNLNWIAGEFKEAKENQERGFAYGEKSPGKSHERLAREILLKHKMPQSILTKVAEGQDFDQVVGHESLDLLASPNPVQKKSEYLQMMLMNLLITGEAYVIGGEYAESPTGFELWAIPTKWITPVHNGGMFTQFIFTPDQFAVEKPLPVDEVMRVYFPHPEDPMKAYSPLMAASNSAKVDEKLQKSQAEHFDGGMFPAVALRVAKLRNADGSAGSQNRPILSSAQRRQITRAVRQVWKQTTANKEPAILDGLIEDIMKLNHTPSEMDWPNSGKIIKERIYQTFRVNPIITGEVVGVNRAQATVVEASFVTNVINPIADSLSTAHTDFIGHWFEQPARLEVFLEKATPEDDELRFKKFAEGRKNGDVTSDEFRAQVLNMPPLTEEEREEQKSPLLGVTGGLQHAIQLAEKIEAGTISRVAGCEIASMFFGLSKETAETMFPEPEEKPVSELPPGVVPPGLPPAPVQEDKPPVAPEPESDEGKSPQQLFREQLRRDISGLHVKQVGTRSAEMANVLVPWFRSQIAHAASELAAIGGEKVANAIQKDSSSTAQALQMMVFNPGNWVEPLVKAIYPKMAELIAEGTFAELALIDSANSNEKTTAGDVVQQMNAAGLDGISTEWPAWLQASITAHLTEQFSQEYWQRIPETTANDIRRFIQEGLEEGWSIRRVASEIENAFTGEYHMSRALTVAKTESSDALNSGHTIAIRQTGEITGLEAGKEWVSVMGSTTRDTHASADGQQVGSDEMFNVGGYLAPHPSHMSLPPGERINCQCTVIAAFNIDRIAGKQELSDAEMALIE